MSATSQRTVDDFDLIQIVCTDINGVPRGRVVTKEFGKKMEANNGCELNQWIACLGTACNIPMSVSEVKHSSFDNSFFWPVMETLVKLPWASKPGRCVGQIIGHIVNEDGTPELTTIRYHAEMQLKRLENMGYKFVSSLTCQFVAYKLNTDFKEFLGGDSRTHSSPYSDIGVEEIMFDLCKQLQTVGVIIETWAGRKGRGAFELTVAPKEGLKIADLAIRVKQGTRSVMAAHGYKATFMTYPPSADVASISPLRFTIYDKDGKNAFYDETKEDKLSDLVRYWLAGMIHHGRGITALCCPTFNCYKRFQADTLAPRLLDWDIDRSSAFLSIIVTGTDVWIENRITTAASNTYLELVATLVTGIDGLEKRLTCPEKSSTYSAPIPESLGQALNELQANQLLEEALSHFLFKVFVTIKYEYEFVPLNKLEASNADDREEKIRALENSLYFTRL